MAKANANETYTKTYVDSALEGVYTKAATDDKFITKVDSWLDMEANNTATSTYLENTYYDKLAVD